MTDYSKITALYSRLSVGDEDRDGGESNSIQNQKKFLESYVVGVHFSKESKDTLEDKMKRLMRDDVKAANF